MKIKKILGVFRLPIFSNNAIEADRKILEESLKLIESAAPESVKIHTCEETDLETLRPQADLVLTMAQSESALLQLSKKFLPHQVLNNSEAIRSCYRKKMSETLISLPVNYVPFQIVPTNWPDGMEMERGVPYWLKRSDFHAISDEDVSLVESRGEAEEKLRRFQNRGVAEVLVQRHIHGDIYKFYGVSDTFFRAFKVRDYLKSNSQPNFTNLQKKATIAASQLGVSIFGGDAVLDVNGRFHLIDLNDWPSFRLCRNDASHAIAAFALSRLELEPEARPESSLALSQSVQ